MAQAIGQPEKSLRVFISYSRHDLDFVENLVQAIEMQGHKTLIDRNDIVAAESFETQLEGMITDSDVVIYVLTDSAVESRSCEWELNVAIQHQKRIVPVVPKPLRLDPPHDVSILNWIFMHDGKGESRVAFLDGLSVLNNILSAISAEPDIELATEVYSSTIVEPRSSHTAGSSGSVEEIDEAQFDVFLSYARKDLEQVKPFAELLIGQGLSVFYDIETMDGGDEFPDEIQNSLSKSRTIVACFSPIYFTRPWCKLEARYAWHTDRLIPILIKGMEESAVPIMYQFHNYIDFNDWNGDPGYPEIRKLLAAIEKSRRETRPEEDSNPYVEAPSVAATPAHVLADLRQTWDAIRTRKDKLLLQRFLHLVENQAPGSGLEFEVGLRVSELKKR